VIKNTYKTSINDNGSINYYLVVSGKRNGKSYSFIYEKESETILKKHIWNTVNPSDGFIYGICTCHKYLMHRVIMECTDKNLVVDHINHNTLDNCVKNLRVVTHAKNMRNRKPNNNSKYSLPVPGLSNNGVSWSVRVEKNGIRFNVSGIETLHEAICYRIRKEYELNPNDCTNYRHILSKMPRKLLLIYFPEIYGSNNTNFIGSSIFNAHYKNSKHIKTKCIIHCLGVQKVGTNV
jgi:hypothetical protein